METKKLLIEIMQDDEKDGLYCNLDCGDCNECNCKVCTNQITVK